MSGVYAFLGDELTSAGFRLGGFRAFVVEPAEALARFEAVVKECDLLVITAEIASALPNEILQAALDRGDPSILIVPDARDRAQPPDIGQALRHQLGVE
jgi:vacuolar-type H+-ATPase subunit F/Vma7